MKCKPTTMTFARGNQAELNASIAEDGSFHLKFDAQDIDSAKELMNTLNRFFDGGGLAEEYPEGV